MKLRKIIFNIVPEIKKGIDLGKGLRNYATSLMMLKDNIPATFHLNHPLNRDALKLGELYGKMNFLNKIGIIYYDIITQRSWKNNSEYLLSTLPKEVIVKELIVP